MILNTGGRTDTVQYYSEWLLKRFREGFVLSRNPLFPNIVNRIDLNPDTIDVVVFCSKDYSPILNRLHEISDRFNCYYDYTITAYGTDIEPRVPSIEKSIDTIKRLAAQEGKEKIAWRYDPVLLTEKYTIERHFETFEVKSFRYSYNGRVLCLVETTLSHAYSFENIWQCLFKIFCFHYISVLSFGGKKNLHVIFLPPKMD